MKITLCISGVEDGSKRSLEDARDGLVMGEVFHAAAI